MTLHLKHYRSQAKSPVMESNMTFVRVPDRNGLTLSARIP